MKSSVENLLLMVNLHRFKELDVKDVTEFHSLKVSITKSISGESSFSFFNRSDPIHALFSVHCVSEANQLNKIKGIYHALTEQRKNIITEVHSNA